MNRALSVIAVCSLLIFSGCASLEDAEKARKDQITEFSPVLEERSVAELASPMTLDACLRLAMRESYSVKQAELKRALAKLDKNISFANFLPTVDLSANLVTWSKQQKMMGTFTADKTYRNAEASLGMPLLMPSLWFLYANRKLGVSVSDISAHYVRQSVVLEVTTCYYNCLVSEDMIVSLETQSGAAKSQYERVKGLAKEGFVAKWELEQAFYQYKARATELAVARRKLNTHKSALLEAMGLSPLAQITLDRTGTEFAEPAENVEKLVLTALEHHPSLSMADHAIVMRENSVRAAITSFLPSLSGFVNGTWTGDGYADYVSNLYGGLSATWNVFKGFASMAEYKQAKIGKESAMLDREATFLSVILEVVKAEATLRDAVESLELAEVSYSSAKSKYVEYEGRQKEGLIPLYELLDAQADMDEAHAVLSRMKYQRHLALAALRMAMGTIGEDVIAGAEQKKEN